MDLRAIVEARRLARGLTRAALASRMAARWGCQPKSAEVRITRWIGRSREMTSDALAALLDELNLDVVPRSKPGQEKPWPDARSCTHLSDLTPTAKARTAPRSTSPKAAARRTQSSTLRGAQWLDARFPHGYTIDGSLG